MKRTTWAEVLAYIGALSFIGAVAILTSEARKDGYEDGYGDGYDGGWEDAKRYYDPREHPQPPPPQPAAPGVVRFVVIPGGKAPEPQPAAAGA